MLDAARTHADRLDARRVDWLLVRDASLLLPQHERLLVCRVAFCRRAGDGLRGVFGCVAAGRASSTRRIASRGASL